MTIRGPISARIVTAILLLLSAPLARAGMVHVDCRSPMVFGGAAVNVVVLPYAYAGDNRALAAMGNRLSLLVKLDILSHILDYGSVGAVQMEMPAGVPSTGATCQPENVLPVLLGARPPNAIWPSMTDSNRDAQSMIRAGRGLVLVWGLLYQEGDDIFVQTYAQFLRRGVDETITFQAGGSTFAAALSARRVAFAPQKFSQRDLEQIEASYMKADFVRDQPDDNAPGDQLPMLVAKCAGYGCDDSPVHAGFYVTERQGEWIRIQYLDPVRGQRKEGWIHAAGGVSGTPLDKILPELNFIEGCAGYLRLRVADAEKTPQPPGAYALANDQLNAFVRSNESQPNDIANAVAIQLAGTTNYLAGYPAGRDRIDSLVTAANDFERARRILPYDPNAITLAVGSQVAVEWRQKGRCEQTVRKSEQLSTAVGLGSAPDALTNLNNFYAMLLRIPEQPPASQELTKAAIAERVTALKGVTISQ